MYIQLSLLRRHVEESNKIESIRIRSGGPYVQAHLSAAIAVARDPKPFAVCPNNIHWLLTRGTEMDWHGGAARDCRVWVGNHAMPRPEHLPMLLEWWDVLVRTYLEGGSGQKENAERASLLHDLFLAIHPYQDGNGRTARLLLNALRLSKGLAWVVIEARERQRYYRRIRQIEERVFQNEFPDVY